MNSIIRTAMMTALATSCTYIHAAELNSDTQKISYTLGADMGETISQLGDDIDVDVLIEGLKKAYLGETLEMTPEEMEAAMKSFAEKRMKALQTKQNEEAAQQLEKGTKFLEENKSKEGVKTTDSGLQYIVVEAGEGAQPKETDTVTVEYEGRLIDGTVFDSTEKHGQPISFALNEVIPGWTEGLQLMKIGANYTFFIPAQLAYGEQGAGAVIPPNATLIFDVELININSDKEESK